MYAHSRDVYASRVKNQTEPTSLEWNKIRPSHSRDVYISRVKKQTEPTSLEWNKIRPSQHLSSDQNQTKPTSLELNFRPSLHLSSLKIRPSKHLSSYEIRPSWRLSSYEIRPSFHPSSYEIRQSLHLSSYEIRPSMHLLVNTPLCIHTSLRKFLILRPLFWMCSPEDWHKAVPNRLSRIIIWLNWYKIHRFPLKWPYISWVSKFFIIRLV